MTVSRPTLTSQLPQAVSVASLALIVRGAGRDGQPPLGKSAKWCDPKKHSGYRHEFGSLLRIEYPQRHQTECDPPVDPGIRDRALHLIAAHHGHARPHFSNSFDKEFSQKCEATHIETIRRFARLQRKYGGGDWPIWNLFCVPLMLQPAPDSKPTTRLMKRMEVIREIRFHFFTTGSCAAALCTEQTPYQT